MTKRGKKVSGLGFFLLPAGCLLATGCSSPTELPTPTPATPSSSPEAHALFSSLHTRFRLAPVAAPTLPGESPSSPADPQPLLRRSSVERYEVRDGWVIPHLPDSAFRGVVRPARVRLPLRASGVFEVRDEKSGLAIRVERVGATEAVVEEAEGWALYRGGVKGGDVLHLVHGEGTEDYVHFTTKPEVEELRYRVDVSAVAGLRLVSNVVEFVDGEGYPRLRVTAPMAVDARGEKVALRLGVEGCAYDENPAAPWERAVVAPGKEACEVVVGWEGGEYPLVVDPAFVSAGSLAVGRYYHTASALADGSVLVVGGRGNDATACPNNYCKTAERWVNGGFSAAGSLAVGRAYHTASALADGSVLVVGGYNTNDATACPNNQCKTAERWVNGGFSAAGSLAVGRAYHTASALADGSVLVVGGYGTHATACPIGYCKTAERWVNGGFSAAGSLAVGRQRHTASALADGSVLVVGGSGIDATACPNNRCKTAERWVNGGFSAAGSLAVGRYYHTASALADGSVLVVGGLGYDATACPSGYCETAERWVNGGFSAAGSLAVGRYYHTASALADGSVLVVGGYNTNDATACPNNQCKTAERWVNGGFSAAGSLAVGRSGHTASALADGSVLVVGGHNHTDATACPSGDCKTAERWEPNASDLGKPCSSALLCSSGFCADGVCCNEPCLQPGFSCRFAETGQPDGTCALVPNGTPCSEPSSCSSGFCVDGVCCDSPCQALCFACLASKTGGLDGLCLPIPENTDPENECTPLGAGVCQTPGVCDGKGACASKSGTLCGEGSCLDATTQIPPSQCDASGACIQQPASTCFPYVCSKNQCKTSCSSSLDCVAQAGFDCVEGKCVKAGDLGSPCSSNDNCLSGFCVDGVCCDTACAGVCKACSAKLKGYGKDGSCADVKFGTDPDDDCPEDPPASCKNTGFCNGSGGCERYGANTVCAQTSCKDGVLSGVTCDGVGNCGPQKGDSSCGLYACADAVSCGKSCSNDAGCAVNAHCVEGACVADLPPGTPCAFPAQCASGFCVDGVCCDAPCSGQCEACAQTGSVGQCKPVPAGQQPVGNRAPCNASDPECAGACDGGNPTACKYPDATKLCAATSCNGAVLTPVVCNGQGSCTTQPVQDCGLRACDDQAGRCKESCSNDGDCASGAVCNQATGQCSLGATSCADDFTVKTANGTLVPCKGKCLAGQCQETCSGPADCAKGYSCQNATCVQDSGAGGQGGMGDQGGTAGSGGVPAAPAEVAEEGGCGCAVPGRSASAHGAWLGLALGLAAFRRRRAA